MKESCEDVRSVQVLPNIMMIKLCDSRTNLWWLDEETILEEAQSLNLEEAPKQSDYIVQQGDRSINITLKRAIGSLGHRQKLKLVWNILTNKNPIKKEDVKVKPCMTQDLLHDMLAETAREYHALASVFVDERDIFLATDAIPEHAHYTSGRVINNFNSSTVQW